MHGGRVIIKKKDSEFEVVIKDKIVKTNEANQHYDVYIGHDIEGKSVVFSPFDIIRWII